MRSVGKGFVRTLRALLRRETGVAAVEFALVVPLMLSVYLGCTEAAALLTADRKVQSVAGAIGDLVARSNKTIAQSQLRDYFLASTSIMAPYSTSGLVQTVTAVSVDDDGEATVLWSVRYENGSLSTTVAEHPKNSAYDLPAEMRAIATGQTVIAAEAEYGYLPLLGIVFKEALDLNRSALFMPRFGGTITLN
ncbi:MAG: TadE/TadG family type IV pilus assembly protein [Devosia sp.]|uniref:TadE/TadG family type IV pilus assembly protein n=1 Tax=Devosia sp. TaxID=1871048 RepID=UPI0033914A9E